MVTHTSSAPLGFLVLKH